jgi:hypothetical protein
MWRHPSIRRSRIWPLTTSPKSRTSAASSVGRLPWVFTRRRNSSWSRSITFVILSVFHCALGNAKNVSSSSPPPGGCGSRRGSGSAVSVRRLRRRWSAVGTGWAGCCGTTTARPETEHGVSFRTLRGRSPRAPSPLPARRLIVVGGRAGLLALYDPPRCSVEWRPHFRRRLLSPRRSGITHSRVRTFEPSVKRSQRLADEVSDRHRRRT